VPRETQVPFQTERWFTDAFRRNAPDEVRRVVDVFLATDSRVHATASRAMGEMDSRALLGDVIAPTLVLTGEEDYATPPEMAQVIAENVKDGRAVTLPHLRHLSLIERPSLTDVITAHFEDGA
jgi:3-oxoadipate enol-lactonase